MTAQNVASYSSDREALRRKFLPSKECRAPLFPVLQKLLENPLEELVTDMVKFQQAVTRGEVG